jgi:glycosyltransferase involved in cell wall biosynthesis
MSDNQTLVAFCIPTFKRPVILKQCLLAIGQLNLPANLSTIIIVVDNDSDQTSEEICNDISPSLDQVLHYYVEPNRGLCSVRNCLLQKAVQHQADLIAFIDDDEMPHKDWLINIYNGLLNYSVDIATGPVISTKEITPPIKYEAGHKYKTGVTPRYISSNNVIFKSRLVSELELTFDPYYNFIGGEDFDYFVRASKLGCTAVWINEAVIFEQILPERETSKYKMFRHYTGGINNVLRYKKTFSSLAAWFHFIPKILGKLIGSVISLIKAAFSNHSKNLEKSYVKLASGAGYIAGLLNIIRERYRY